MGYNLPVFISLGVVEAVLCVGLDFFAHSGEAIPTIGGEVLGNADLGEKVGFEGDDALGCLVAV